MSTTGMMTNLQGRLRNTHLPKSHGLLPLFEAVVNSIHAIEEAEVPSLDGKITVEIMRRAQGQLPFDGKRVRRGPVPVEEIVGFRITDNGVGFTDVNFESFQTLDSEHKIEKGCRGIGRLIWLKAFDRVNVCSTYFAPDNVLRSRRFTFNSRQGVNDPVDVVAESGAVRETIIHLDGFHKEYRDASRKTATTIADSLFEHCLWYFVRDGGAPEIVLVDGDERIDLHQVYTGHIHADVNHEDIEIGGHRFYLTHVKLRSTSQQVHTMALCAGNRLVQEENITGKIPGLFGRIEDENGEYVYTCYVGSPFLDQAVRAERTGFDIPEDAGELLKATELTLPKIRDAVLARAKALLAEHLEANKQMSRQRVEDFVSRRAPRYRPILARVPQDELSVDPAISDRDLDIMLHRQFAKIEEALLDEGHNLMVPGDDENLAEYEKRLQSYLDKAQDIKKSDLANYVAHRRVILDLLAKAVQRQTDGRYAKEELIHRLIMPLRKSSEDILLDSCNLWLVDERLAFHDYLASDKTLQSMPITGSDDTKEPDVVVLNVLDTPILVSEEQAPPLASIVVVEIKRPMRDDARGGEDKDPIEQALGYIERIRDGRVKTRAGRPIPRSETIPGFCYVLCDLTPSIEQRCKMHNLRATSDNMGYFGFNDNYRAYIEVISFDRLVEAARQRNKAFFDKLGLPTTTT